MTLKNNKLFIDGKEYQYAIANPSKSIDNEIVYMPYIPIMKTVESDSSDEDMNKRFAKVKLTNDNPYYRGKTCEILKETTDDSGHKKYLLEIEVGNSCSSSGMTTLVAYVKMKGSPYWKKIWFDEDEIEVFK